MRQNRDSSSKNTARRFARLPLSTLRRRRSQLLAAIARQKQAKAYALIPVEIFSKELSPAEALVKWLKEEHKLGFTRIATILNRDVSSVWLTYKNAQKKHSAPLKPAQKPAIPISLFKDRSRSILEHLVLFLKTQQGLNLTTISVLLRKHHNTIWTAYQRGRRKRS